MQPGTQVPSERSLALLLFLLSSLSRDYHLSQQSSVSEQQPASGSRASLPTVCILGWTRSLPMFKRLREGPLVDQRG